MVNRYDRPAEAQFINTYVPLPFQQLYTLGKEANARVDKAIADLSGALDKWSDLDHHQKKILRLGTMKRWVKLNLLLIN